MLVAKPHHKSVFKWMYKWHLFAWLIKCSLPWRDIICLYVSNYLHEYPVFFIISLPIIYPIYLITYLKIYLSIIYLPPWIMLPSDSRSFLLL